MEETNEPKDALDPWKMLWGESVSEDGLVAAVDPSDMKSVWRMGRETQAAAQAVGSTGSHAISMGTYTSVCSPGANVTAVWYRLGMLGLCEQMGLLGSYKVDSEFTDAVFRVAATFPMKRMEMGVTYPGPPFAVDEFLKQVENASAG